MTLWEIAGYVQAEKRENKLFSLTTAIFGEGRESCVQHALWTLVFIDGWIDLSNEFRQNIS